MRDLEGRREQHRVPGLRPGDARRRREGPAGDELHGRSTRRIVDPRDATTPALATSVAVVADKVYFATADCAILTVAKSSPVARPDRAGLPRAGMRGRVTMTR